MKTISVMTIAMGVAIILSACAEDDPNANSEIANPASIYCIDQGGEVLIKTGDDGQYGICKLPDGREIDEWEFYRQNNPG